MSKMQKKKIKQSNSFNKGIVVTILKFYVTKTIINNQLKKFIFLKIDNHIH